MVALAGAAEASSTPPLMVPTATHVFLLWIGQQEQAEALVAQHCAKVNAHVAHNSPPLQMLFVQMAHPQVIIIGKLVPQSQDGAPLKHQVSHQCMQEDLKPHLYWQLLHCSKAVRLEENVRKGAMTGQWWVLVCGMKTDWAYFAFLACLAGNDTSDGLALQ